MLAPGPQYPLPVAAGPRTGHRLNWFCRCNGNHLGVLCRIIDGVWRQGRVAGCCHLHDACRVDAADRIAERLDVSGSAQAHVHHLHSVSHDQSSASMMSDRYPLPRRSRTRGCKFSRSGQPHDAKCVVFCGNDTRHVRTVAVVIFTRFPRLDEVDAAGEVGGQIRVIGIDAGIYDRHFHSCASGKTPCGGGTDACDAPGCSLGRGGRLNRRRVEWVLLLVRQMVLA